MPVRSVDLIDAIRGGATSTREIAQTIHEYPSLVSVYLNKLRTRGVVISTPDPELGAIAGQPFNRWAINEDYRPRRKVTPEGASAQSARMIARRLDPDAEARRKAAWRATMAAKAIEIPGWVMLSHRRTYREIARVLDEETAARWARAAKAKTGRSAT